MRLVGLLVIGLALYSMQNVGIMLSGAQARRPQQRNARSTASRIDYSTFSHSTHVTKQKLACDSCHKFPTKNWNQVRKGDTAFQDVAEFPEHESCLTCHRSQFFARERPQPVICSNCHLNVTPRDTARFLFPSLGDVTTQLTLKPDTTSEFAVNFPHDKHLDALGWNKPTDGPRFTTVSWQKPNPAESSEQKTCPICHQTYQPQGTSDDEYLTKPPKDLGDNFWLKKGTFKTIPVSHTGCFTCHNVEVGITPAPADCNACHKFAVNQITKTDFDPGLLKTMGITDRRTMTSWRRRISSGSFRHEGGEHPKIGCTNCHHVATMSTTNVKTLSVAVRTCGGAEGCHVTATSDDGGILNYEIDQRKANASFVCTKCHLTFGKDLLPDTHINAIQALKKPDQK